jgi:hypothetical protein
VKRSSFNDFLRHVHFSRIRDLKKFIAFERSILDETHVCYEPASNFYTIYDIGYKNIVGPNGIQRVKVKKIKDRGGLAWYEIDKTFNFL